MDFKMVLFAGMVLLIGTVHGQVADSDENDISDLIEALASSGEGEHDYAMIAEDLNHYLREPLNINVAKPEELSRLHLLNPFQINSLQEYISTHGPMLSIYELPLVFGFSIELSKSLAPFISVESLASKATLEDLSPAQMLRKGRHQIILRSGKILEKQKGFRSISDSLAKAGTNKRYLGNALKLYSKYTMQYYDYLDMGFTAEKDPGERFFSGDNRHGFDFNSFHLLLSGIRGIDRIALGDYRIRYGQGLIAWSGFTLHKSPMVLNIMKSHHRIAPYTSSNENRFFRGIAMEKSVGHFRGSFFYSRKNIDANISEIRESGSMVVSSLLETGYHRLPRELEDENSLNERVLGGNLSLNKSHFRLSVNGLFHSFNGEIQHRNRPYQYYRFTGRQLMNVSADYQVIMKRLYMFGEEAMNSRGGKAFLNGLTAQLSPQVGMVLLHRKYDRNYEAFYSGAFADGSRNQNESGLYLGLKLNLTPSITFNTYMDTYRFPWLRYLADAPSRGWDYLLNMEYSYGEHSALTLRMKKDHSFSNFNAPETKLSTLAPENTTRFRCHLTHHLTEQIVLKNRAEIVINKAHSSSKGMMIYQDVCYKSLDVPIGLDFRFALFDTDDYESRIYAYEHDLLYVFSVPAYSGRGYRTYVNLKYRCRNTHWYLKLARTGFADRQTIGSGLNEIEGNVKTSLNFQVRIRF